VGKGKLIVELELKLDPKEFSDNFELAADEFEIAFETAKNMVASMIETESKADITSAGNFDGKGLTVTVDGNTIRTELDIPGGDIFESGGTIQGNPLLWIPISGTDAAGTRASAYPGKLFSVNRKAGGPPLLFSMADKAPKYFGVPSVFIPKKFHLAEIQLSVMERFKDIFAEEFNG
jgi:hypothetical protein